MTKLEDMQFELAVDRKALVEDRGRLVRSQERESELPEHPASFRPLYGSYQRVSQEACRRNQVQIRSGFLDYLYSVEPRGAKPNKRAAS